MKCKKCNNEIQNGFKFCPICGTPVALAIFCPKCGAKDIPQDSKFCPDCGVLLGIDQEEAQCRFEEAKKLEAGKARRRKQTESAKQQEIARKKELERKAEEVRKKTEAETRINGHEYIDLGLPSGTLWATCNIGVSYPEEIGDHYAWGELESKRSYTETGNKWKYTPAFWFKLKGIIDSKMNLSRAYDVASIKWGTKWHIPTREQLVELKENTKISRITRNGVNVCLVTSQKNEKSIVLPNDWQKMSGTAIWVVGGYWSSTKNGDIDYAFFLNMAGFSIDKSGLPIAAARSIRPVSER